jgi:hypothetical protein
VKLKIVALASFSVLSVVSLVGVVSTLGSLGCANANSTFLFTDAGKDGSTSAKDGGGENDGGSTGTGTSDCTDFCTAMVDKGVACDDTAKCTSLCKADTKTATTAGCTDERNAFLECGSSGKKGVLVTCSSTKISITGCSAQKNALDDCIANGPTSTDDAGPTGSCTLQQQIFNSAACNTCAEKNCCTEWNACLNSSDCIALINCITACTAGDTTCENNCASSHPTGTNLYNAGGTCMETPCSTACGL